MIPLTPLMRPIAVDLFCGLGGWAEGLLAEGWDVIGFDIERHRYPGRVLGDNSATKVLASNVDFMNPREAGSACRSFNYANQKAVKEMPLSGIIAEYPGQLVIQDVLTLHGSQFRDVDLIVASPPCQEYSYMAMPWTRAKAKAAAIRADTSGKMLADLNRLFDACFRIQAQASLAAGRHIPMVVENVRGAQRWVGQARWNFGSFYLWGDVPALMPISGVRKVAALHLNLGGGNSFARARGSVAEKRAAVRYAPIHAERRANEAINHDGRKVTGGGAGGWFGNNDNAMRQHHSGHVARKEASAIIAKIPLPLARHIAAVYRP